MRARWGSRGSPRAAVGKASCGQRAAEGRDEATPSAPRSAERERPDAESTQQGGRRGARSAERGARCRAAGAERATSREGARNHATTDAQAAEESGAVRCGRRRRDVQRATRAPYWVGYGAAASAANSCCRLYFTPDWQQPPNRAQPQGRKHSAKMTRQPTKRAGAAARRK